MILTKKFSIIGICLILMVYSVSAQEAADAGVTPDSFLWGLDKALDQLTLLLTFDKGEKAKKGLEIARERLLEVRAMVEENKLDAAEKAKEEHGKSLLKIKQSIKDVEKINSTEEIKQVIEVEKKLEEHNKNIEQTFGELKVKIEIKGEITQQQKELVESILNSLKGQTGEVEIEIKNKKDKTKIKIKQETGKSEDEIEEEVEEIEREEGLTDIKREKALEEINDAKEDLVALEMELEDHKLEGHVANETPITTLMDNARDKLAKAEETFNASDFGEAFGQANAAQQLIKNAERVLEKTVETFEEEAEAEEERKIEVEIEDEKAKVKVEIGDEKLRFVLETTDRSTIIQEIATRTGLSVEEVTKLVEFEVEEKKVEKKETKEERKAKKNETEQEEVEEKEEKSKSGKLETNETEDKENREDKSKKDKE